MVYPSMIKYHLLPDNSKIKEMRDGDDGCKYCEESWSPTN